MTTVSTFRKVPCIVTLNHDGPEEDQIKHGLTSQSPALLTVHSSGAVTVHENVRNVITPVFTSRIVGSWQPEPGGNAGLIPTEDGEIAYTTGPGCACGNPIKSFRAPDPDKTE